MSFAVRYGQTGGAVAPGALMPAGPSGPGRMGAPLVFRPTDDVPTIGSVLSCARDRRGRTQPGLTGSVPALAGPRLLPSVPLTPNNRTNAHVSGRTEGLSQDGQA